MFSTAVVAPVKILNDGNKIPIVALGTGRGTAIGVDLEEVRQAVFWAIEAGYRHIDTAAVYKDELQVGQGVADAIAQGLVKREDLFITTKADGSADDVDYLETWQGMEEAKELGLAKSIGISNFNTTQLDRLFANSKVKPAVNQIEVNPTLTQEDLVSHCKKLGVVVMAYSPFGFLVSRRGGDDAPPPRRDDPTLAAIANKYGKSPEQVVLRYLIDRDLIPIPKSTNKERIAQNINTFDFQLTPEEISTISAFNKNKRVIEASYWKGFPNFPFEDLIESKL